MDTDSESSSSLTLKSTKMKYGSYPQTTATLLAALIPWHMRKPKDIDEISLHPLNKALQ